MKLLLFFFGLGLITVSALILKPIARNLPNFGLIEFLIGGFALSLLGSGLKMVWAALVLP
jgi:hypothetical protein